MFEKVQINQSYFYKCQKDEIKDEVNWAYITAKKKFNFTKDFWDRGCLTRFFDFLFGDLAKNLLKKFLLLKNPLLNIIEYDVIRNDDFESPDIFDLKIGNYELEVKSSLEKYTNNLERMLNQRRIIIGLYKSNEVVPDYRVQVFFIPKEVRNYWDFMQNDRCNCGDFERHSSFILKKTPQLINEVDIYLAGWIKKDDENQKLNDVNRDTLRMRNYKSGQSHREYLNFFINETRKMDDLIEEFKNIDNE